MRRRARCISHGRAADVTRRAAIFRALPRAVSDPRALQNLWVSGGGARERRVTVTPPGSAPITGRLVRIDDFLVTLVQEDGARRTIARTGAVPKVEINDPSSRIAGWCWS